VQSFFNRLVEDNQIIPVVAIIGGLCIAAISIIFGSVKATIVGKQREQTKRELAAYVAEGTISAEKAVEILNAGKKASDSKGGCCA
jgi:hypothetical protein